MRKHIKLILRTLFSNNACVEAARTKEIKYNVIGVVFVVLALFFAALPTCVTGFKQQGGAWLRGGVTYNFDGSMIDFKEAAQEADPKITLELNDKHELIEHNWNAFDQYNEAHPDLHCFTAYHVNPEDTDKHKTLEVFYCPESMKFTSFVSDIANNLDPYVLGNKKTPEKWLESETKKRKDGTEYQDLKARTTSFIVFGFKQVQGAILAPGTTSGAASNIGDYAHIKPANDLITEVLVSSTNKEQIIKDCAKFFDKAYINTRKSNTWRSTGIILGVDSGVIILMGFMVWVLTRGKNNPFRIYSFWDAQKIAYYASLTPGIIALFGFLMSNLAMMLFIIGEGIRVMWLSMRTLRYQAPAKQ